MKQELAEEARRQALPLAAAVLQQAANEMPPAGAEDQPSSTPSSPGQQLRKAIIRCLLWLNFLYCLCN